MAQVSTSNVERSSDEGRSEFVVVANRLPVRHEDDGSWTLSPGGLVSAMLPVRSSPPLLLMLQILLPRDS